MAAPSGKVAIRATYRGTGKGGLIPARTTRWVPTTNSADLAHRLPDSQLVTYPDAGHGGILPFHAQFIQKALEFLGR
jgi:pimeloyl-ACP methyl ester carboxylesterase